MSTQIHIPDNIYNQLAEVAKKNNVTIDLLTAQLLEQALSRPVDESIVRMITKAYAEGRETPSLGDWSQVEAELNATKPIFETLEEAMDYSRGRS